MSERLSQEIDKSASLRDTRTTRTKEGEPLSLKHATSKHFAAKREQRQVEAHSFGSRLKALRERAGITQQEFSEKVRIPVNTIARYEHGEQKPSRAIVRLLAKRLSVDPTALTD